MKIERGRLNRGGYYTDLWIDDGTRFMGADGQTQVLADATLLAYLQSRRDQIAEGIRLLESERKDDRSG